MLTEKENPGGKNRLIRLTCFSLLFAVFFRANM